jgi:hypothetical protein
MRGQLICVLAIVGMIMGAPAEAKPRQDVNVMTDGFGGVAGWDRQGVVLARSLPWESNLMQDPAIVYDQGGGPRFKMWYGSLWNIGYATSEDGRTWTKNPNPVVSQTLDSESGALNQPSVVYRDGVWHMTYFGVTREGVGRIHYAEATNPSGPWTKFGPIVVPTEAWEDDYIYNSSLMYDNGVWKMWYTAGRIASAGGEPEFICYATATNPRGPWTKSPSNPLVSPMGDGGWASLGIGGPNVRKKADGTYEMVVVGWQADYPSRGGKLSSRDGVTWRLDRSKMTLDLGAVGGAEASMVYRQFVVDVNGTDYVYYNAKDTSPDWTEKVNLAIWRPSVSMINPARWAMTQGWDIPNGASWSVVGGQARSLGTATPGHPQTLQGNVRVDSTDYSVSAEVTPLSAGVADRDTVLIARSTDRQNYYYAGIASWGNKYAIGKLVNGQNTKLTGVGTSADIRANTTYHLRLVVRGASIQLYDNGVLVASAVDTSLTPPVSYVELQTTTSTGQAAFDNVSIDMPAPERGKG